MNCNIMKELLIAYVYEDISQKDRLQLEKHLERCQKCSTELQHLQDVRLFCDYWQEQPVNKNLLHNTFLKTKPDILTPEELAVYLRVTKDEIVNNVDQIPHVRIGKSLRFRRHIILKWLEHVEYWPDDTKDEATISRQYISNRISRLLE